MSKKVPRINSSTLIIRKMTHGALLTDFINSPVSCGTSYKAMKYPNALEMPINSSTTPVVLQALAQALKKLCHDNER